MRLPEPTKAETRILNSVWTRGVATVRDVVDDLGRDGRASETGTSTIMRRMVIKGLLRVVEERKPQRFEAVLTRDETYRQSLEGLNSRFGARSIAALVSGLLGRRKPSAAELDEIRRVLDEHGKASVKPGERDERPTR